MDEAVTMETQSPLIEIPPPGRLQRLRDVLFASRWAFPPLLVLIVARALLIHNDVSDFPLDRNIGAAFYIGRIASATTWDQLSFHWSHYAPLFQQPDIPEFPFLPLLARLLLNLHAGPIAAGRIVSLLAALLTGLGLWILGRRCHSRTAGVAALWFYALLPFSIFMGRSLLPDPVMIAAIIWSLVEAGAPPHPSEWRRVRRTAFWLIVAGLAKLPAVIFAPVAAAFMMQQMGWRRRDAWIKLAVTALLTWLALCAWYHLWNPVAGLKRLSESTNHMLGAVGDLSGARVTWVIMMRCLLGLSLPGAFMALLGLIYLQRSPERLVWNLWAATSLAFVAVSLTTNTYWAYALVPAGCLLAGVAWVELARSFRGAWAPLGALLLVLLWICPSQIRLQEYRTLHPEYRGLRAAAEKNMTRPKGRVYGLGQLPSDILYFSGCVGDGISYMTWNTEQIDQIIKKIEDKTVEKDQFAYVINGQMIQSPVTERLFARFPVLALRPGEYAMFDLGAKLGKAAPPAAPRNLGQPLDLAGRLRIIDLNTSPTTPIAPGGGLDLNVTFEKGPQYQGPPNLAVQFIHVPSPGTKSITKRTTFTLAPTSNGLELASWTYPLLQTPDFTRATRETMRYHYELPPHMPAGTYQLQFMMPADRIRPERFEKPKFLAQPAFEIAPPAKVDALPITVDLKRAFWRTPNYTTMVSWLGARRDEAILNSNAQLCLCPALPPGDYQLELTASAQPAGGNPKEMWPVVLMQQPDAPEAQMRFKSESSRTQSIRFRWRGPQDFLALTIANPWIDYSTGEAFSLYLDDCAKGNRGIMIEKIVIEKAR